MRLSSFSPPAIQARLAAGLGLRTGSYAVRVRSRVPGMGEALSRLYGDFPVADGPFADFHVTVDAVRGLRRWVRPQVGLNVGGRQPFKPLPLDQAPAMLEWGLNWCIYSHVNDRLVLHAACVERDGRALLMPGPPGSGKSTLTAALVCQGWRLISDELALVVPDRGQIEALARPVGLKNGSIDAIRAFAPEAVFGPEIRDTAKGRVAHMRPPAGSVLRMGEPAVPRTIVLPTFAPGATTELTPLSRSRAFMELAAHGFNYSQLGLIGFRALEAVVDAAEHCFTLRYGDLDDALGRLSGL